MEVPFLVRMSELGRSSYLLDESTLEDPLPWPAALADGESLDTKSTKVRQETTDDA